MGLPVVKGYSLFVWTSTEINRAHSIQTNRRQNALVLIRGAVNNGRM